MHYAEAEYLLAGDGSVNIAGSLLSPDSGLTRRAIIHTILTNPPLLAELERYSAIRAGKILLPERLGEPDLTEAAQEVRRRAQIIVRLWKFQLAVLFAAAGLTLFCWDRWPLWLLGLTGSWVGFRIIARRYHRAGGSPLPVSYRSVAEPAS